jgi:phage baseplate assembly protein W
MALADRKTLERKKTELYSDFITSFAKNPHTGYLGRVTNEESVKQSLKNLFLTNKGERFYNSNLGSSIRDMLFDLVDPADFEIMKMKMRELANAHEPRAVIQDIRINNHEEIDTNTLHITIVFSIINILEQNFELDITIERVR